jgi:hypothetical protein
MKPIWSVAAILASIVAPPIWAASVEDVTFLTRIQTYEIIANTTLVTQEGKRTPLERGTKVNVAGFTETEALVVSRSDRPIGFIRKADLAPSIRSNRLESPSIKEETLPRPNRNPQE